MDQSRHLQLLACLLLSEPLYKEVRRLDEELRKQFDEFSAIWLGAVEAYYELWESMPTVDSLLPSLEVRIAKLSMTEQTAMAGTARRVIRVVKHTLEEQAAADIETTGRALFREWLTELRAAKTAAQLTKSPLRAKELLEEASRDLSVIDGVELGRFKQPFVRGGIGGDPQVFETTGIDFVDAFCGGGLSEGEVYAHSAPTGQGKTTLVLQLCWSRAERLLSRHDVTDLETADWSKIPKIYAFFFESVENMLAKFISNAASIPREIALAYWKTKDPTKLSSAHKRNSYRDYELKLFESAIESAKQGKAAWPAGELERFVRVAKVANELVRVVDYSGNDRDLLDWSVRGVQGMRNYVDADQDREKSVGVDLIACDYVGAMVAAMINDGRAKDDNRTQLITTTPALLVRECAARFACPVWASHQLNSDENRRAGGTIPNPHKNDGSGMFLERCAMGCASGMLTKQNAAVFVHAKHRNGELLEPQIVELRKDFARWKSTAGRYRLVEGVVMDSREVNDQPAGRNSSFAPPMRGFDGDA